MPKYKVTVVERYAAHLEYEVEANDQWEAQERAKEQHEKEVEADDDFMSQLEWIDTEVVDTRENSDE
jgi:hypothetical protein